MCNYQFQTPAGGSQAQRFIALRPMPCQFPSVPVIAQHHFWWCRHQGDSSEIKSRILFSLKIATRIARGCCWEAKKTKPSTRQPWDALRKALVTGQAQGHWFPTCMGEKLRPQLWWTRCSCCGSSPRTGQVTAHLAHGSTSTSLWTWSHSPLCIPCITQTCPANIVWSPSHPSKGQTL